MTIILKRGNRLVNQWAGGAPNLALDKYEHTYALGYRARAAGYVDAYKAAINCANATAVFAKFAA